ncbi:AAA family ATPase [Pseudomonas amygdali pv. morsprunorum]|uniref:AAA family ATPase n=1 Tax=Pseudomonas amygdali pv. morsprunorum TaxID=129138 RepID=A0AB35QUJ7_PSEA0|nr:AAA family ATPase [Pseudomonas amygdali]MDT3239587.1 AAA family ATPase [Pseudomonas amygdali pv. morsprunorum]
MSILLVGNSKGGVGKSTLGVQLAIGRARQGRDVLLVNADRQASSEGAIALRGEAGLIPAIAFAAYTDGRVLRTQVLHQRDKYDDIIIDAGGRDSSALRAAMAIADVMLVPFAPFTFDVWALEELAELIDEVQGVREVRLPIWAILNMADPNAASRDNLDAMEAIVGIPQLTYLDAPVVRRKAIPNASGFGMHVSEMRPRNSKAVDEIDKLLNKLF